MLSGSSLTTEQVLAVFTEEVAARGGRVHDTFHDGGRLFTRSVLPHVEEVRPGDKLQGGVALKATGEGVWLYPYLFRQVCRNGAIITVALAARSLGAVHQLDPETALPLVLEALGACSAQEVFRYTVRIARTTSTVQSA